MDEVLKSDSYMGIPYELRRRSDGTRYIHVEPGVREYWAQSGMDFSGIDNIGERDVDEVLHNATFAMFD